MILWRNHPKSQCKRFWNTNNFVLAQVQWRNQRIGVRLNRVQSDSIRSSRLLFHSGGYCSWDGDVLIHPHVSLQVCMDSLAQSFAAVSVLCCGLLRQLLQFGRSTSGGTSAQTGHEISSKDPKKQHLESRIYRIYTLFTMFLWEFPFLHKLIQLRSISHSKLAIPCNSSINPLQSSKAILQIRRVVKH